MSKEHRDVIRPTVQADTPTLIEIAEGTGLFKPLEMDAADIPAMDPSLARVVDRRSRWRLAGASSGLRTTPRRR